MERPGGEGRRPHNSRHEASNVGRPVHRKFKPGWPAAFTCSPPAQRSSPRRPAPANQPSRLFCTSSAAVHTSLRPAAPAAGLPSRAANRQGASGGSSVRHAFQHACRRQHSKCQQTDDKATAALDVAPSPRAPLPSPQRPAARLAPNSLSSLQVEGGVARQPSTAHVSSAMRSSSLRCKPMRATPHALQTRCISLPRASTLQPPTTARPGCPGC